MWHTYTRVSTPINTKLLTNDELVRWSTVVNGIREIEETTWRPDQLKDKGDLDLLVKQLVRTILVSYNDTYIQI